MGPPWRQSQLLSRVCPSMSFVFLFFFWPHHVACGILVPEWKSGVLTIGPQGIPYVFM